MNAHAKDVLLTFAAASKRSDEDLYRVLQEVEDVSLLTRDVGSHFTSIMGLLSHIYITDIVWLRRFRDGGVAHNPALKAPIVEEFPFVGFRDLTFPELAQWRQARPPLVDLLAEFVGALSDGELMAAMDYNNAKGKPLRIRRIDACLHVFNHHAHHRGQVSQILDAAGIRNDFSNVTAATAVAR